MRRIVTSLVVVVGLLVASAQPKGQERSLVAPGAAVERLATGFGFLEGPAADLDGNLYFSDIQRERIHRWTPDDGVSTFREATGRANGLRFTPDGQLLICEMGNRRVTAIDIGGQTSVLADALEGQRFNSPNDLWVDPKGGIYFSDPRYGADDDKEMDGDHVYYISPDRSEVRRIADDLVRPNGIVGTTDGSRVYIADHGAGRTYVYAATEDGSLIDKRLFASQGADGMTIDEMGNVYLTGQDITVYDPNGLRIASIAVPEPPANLAFGGADGTTLFITARTSLYAVGMTVTGQ
jgi:gluconolactonase